MEDFKWHIVSEKEKDEINKNVKKILQDFSDKLDNINIDEKHFSSFNNLNGLREEDKCWQTDKTFKEITLSNAPLVEDDFIKTEKANWVK